MKTKKNLLRIALLIIAPVLLTIIDFFLGTNMPGTPMVFEIIHKFMYMFWGGLIILAIKSNAKKEITKKDDLNS